MDWIKHAIDLVLHLDGHLNDLVANYGLWTYFVLFLIVFCETGLVVTPFLPGDSLLFAVGALTASPDSPLNIVWMFVLLLVAAILGDTVNYHMGHYIGERIFTENARILKRSHLERTHAFFEKYGGKTIIIARFVPIVRTFAPFVAGAGAMTYSKFIFYNISGAVLWVGLMLFGGYLFGNLPVVKENFGLVVIAIIVLSLLPMAWEFAMARKKRAKAADVVPNA